MLAGAKLKDYDGFRVGVFGLTTNRTQVIASPDDSLTFIDEVKAAQEMVDILTNKEMCDIVIAVGHIGDILESADHNTSAAISNKVDGIDIFIYGHAHSKFEEPMIGENGTIIVSANEWGKFVGQMDLVIKNGEIVDYDWMPIEVTTEAFPPDAEMVAMLKPYVDKTDESLKDVVMVTSAEFVFGDKLSRKKEIALGKLLNPIILITINNRTDLFATVQNCFYKAFTETVEKLQFFNSFRKCIAMFKN